MGARIITRSVDRRDKRRLQGTACDTTGGHMHGTGLESVENNHRWAADTCNDIAWAI